MQQTEPRVDTNLGTLVYNCPSHGDDDHDMAAKSWQSSRETRAPTRICIERTSKYGNMNVWTPAHRECGASKAHRSTKEIVNSNAPGPEPATRNDE